MSEDAIVLLVATALADLIVLVGWVGLAVGVWIVVTVRMKALLARLPEGKAEEPEGVVRYLLYAVSLVFWPAGVALALYFLTKPETARAGRVCVAMVLVYVTLSVLLAIGIVTAVAVAMPDLLV